MGSTANKPPASPKSALLPPDLHFYTQNEGPRHGFPTPGLNAKDGHAGIPFVSPLPEGNGDSTQLCAHQEAMGHPIGSPMGQGHELCPFPTHKPSPGAAPDPTTFRLPSPPQLLEAYK